MQIRIFAAILIYLASYLPLSFILLIQDLLPHTFELPICEHWLSFNKHCLLPLQHPFYSITFASVCLLSFIFSIFTLSLQTPKIKIRISSAKHVPSDLMNYVLPYVVSFMSLDYGEQNKFLGFLVFFGWIFLITYRSGQVVLNPVLAVFGWRLYEIEFQYVGGDNQIHTGSALAKVEPIQGTIYRHSTIQDIKIITSQEEA